MVDEIIEQFKQYVKDKRLTYAAAAEKIGCDRTHLGRIFSKKRNPSANLLRRMEGVMKNGK